MHFSIAQRHQYTQMKIVMSTRSFGDARGDKSTYWSFYVSGSPPLFSVIWRA